jgi:hypothetical protein
MIRQRIAGAFSLSRGAVIARVAIFLVGVLAALAFWQVSGALNDQPPSPVRRPGRTRFARRLRASTPLRPTRSRCSQHLV